MTRIVVGVDESEPSLDALRWAVEEATRRGWGVRAVLAWSFLDQHGDAPGSFRPDYTAADAQAAAERIIADAIPQGDVEAIAVNDLPGRALVEAAADAALLVVGAHGKGKLKGAVLGSISRHCVQHSPVPVVVVRGRVSDGPVVVGVDGSDNAGRALDWAADAARTRGAVLRVVHAGGHADVLEQALAGLDAGQPAHTEALQVESLHVDGDPARAIVAAGDGASLIVVGSRGRGGVARMLLGSVSEHVVNHSTIPVAVVH